MGNHREASTRGRVLLVLSLFSVGLAGTCFWVFLQFFRQDKLASIREADEVRVNALAGDAQSFVDRIADRLKSWPEHGEQDTAWPERLLESEGELIRVALFRPTGNVSRWEKVQSAGPDADIQLPFGKALARGSYAQAVIFDEKPTLRFAVAIQAKPGSENDGPRDFIAVADARTDRWLLLLARERPAKATSSFLLDSEGRPLVSGGLGGTETMPLAQSALASPGRLAVLTFPWQGRQWLGVTSSVGPLTAGAVTDLDGALKSTRKFAEKAALFGLLGIAAAILVSSWFAGAGAVARSLELHPELGDEFAHLLQSIRLRIDQIKGEIVTPGSKADAERGFNECKEKLEGLSHQAAWAAEIFDKMRRVPTGAKPK